MTALPTVSGGTGFHGVGKAPRARRQFHSHLCMLENNRAITSSSVIYAGKIAQHFLLLRGCKRAENLAVLRVATTVGLHDRTAGDLLGIGEVRSTLVFKRMN
jgi:hypothetical protein